MKNILLVLLALAAACAGPKPASVRNSEGKNNVISAKEENSRMLTENSSEAGTGGGNKVIFKGNDNLLEIISKNTAFFNDNRSVIIIEGNNNTFKLYNTNILDLRRYNTDTLIIVGNHSKYVLDVYNTIIPESETWHTDTLQLFPAPVPIEQFEEDLAAREEWEKQRLAEVLNSEDPEEYYRLGQDYRYGDGVEVSYKIAIELLEYSAVQNHIMAIRTLGDMYQNGSFFIPSDRKKAVYYYTVGSRLGDEYCQEQLAAFQ